MGHRKIPPAIKAEAVRLVVKAGHAPPQAASMPGLAPTAVRRWIDEWHQRQAGLGRNTNGFANNI